MKPELKAPPQEVLAGLAERVTFHNDENGFCVLRTKARGHRDLVTVVGQAASISAGEWITASGEWINDRTHGPQLPLPRYANRQAMESAGPLTPARVCEARRVELVADERGVDRDVSQETGQFIGSLLAEQFYAPGAGVLAKRFFPASALAFRRRQADLAHPASSRVPC